MTAADFISGYLTSCQVQVETAVGLVHCNDARVEGDVQAAIQGQFQQTLYVGGEARGRVVGVHDDAVGRVPGLQCRQKQ